MERSASDTLVRSMNAIVYMMKATGMMWSQRWERMRLGSRRSSLTSKRGLGFYETADGDECAGP